MLGSPRAAYVVVPPGAGSGELGPVATEGSSVFCQRTKLFHLEGRCSIGVTEARSVEPCFQNNDPGLWPGPIIVGDSRDCWAAAFLRVVYELTRAPEVLVSPRLDAVADVRATTADGVEFCKGEGKGRLGVLNRLNMI